MDGPADARKADGRSVHVLEVDESCHPYYGPYSLWCFKQFNRVELYTELIKSSPRILVPSVT